ncbi:MAG: isocitrate/isopropylmalate family dehydrogenase, partial [Kiritimatiellae bacterium]|nr:isocitrate/isopropylmalate family dehydrogenase [Kiritimatiellia bacterium]
MSDRVYNIASIPGDGTGPEVVGEALKVLHAAEKQFGFRLNVTPYDLGGERYLKTGEILPDSVLDELRGMDSILLGAIGHVDVKPGILEKGILLKLRFGLDQYINLRPVKLFPGVETPLKNKTSEHIDYVVVRENSGGLYTGAGGTSMIETEDEVAMQCMI